ncbi:CBS domain-containing protein [Chloroflexota bacterium]
MLVQGVMTTNVVTVSRSTPVMDALKIMKEHDFRRLPVVDKKGQLVGLVTQARLERVKPSTVAPLLWQITYILSHTTVSSAMRKNVVIVKPTDTVEYAIAKAQSNKVGTLVVLDERKIVGICTTNDFFYKIVNPTLGFGKPGTRILINGGGTGESAQSIINCVNEARVSIILIWTSPSSTANENDITLQLDTEDATAIIKKLEKLGFSVDIRAR